MPPALLLSLYLQLSVTLLFSPGALLAVGLWQDHAQDDLNPPTVSPFGSLLSSRGKRELLTTFEFRTVGIRA